MADSGPQGRAEGEVREALGEIRSRLTATLEDDPRFGNGVLALPGARDEVWPEAPPVSVTGSDASDGSPERGTSAEAFRRIVAALEQNSQATVAAADATFTEWPKAADPQAGIYAARADVANRESPVQPVASLRRESVGERLAEAERLLQELERQTEEYREPREAE